MKEAKHQQLLQYLHGHTEAFQNGSKTKTYQKH